MAHIRRDIQGLMNICYRIRHKPTGLFYGKLPPTSYRPRKSPRNNFTAHGDVYFTRPGGLLTQLSGSWTVHDGQRLDLPAADLEIVEYKLVETAT